MEMNNSIPLSSPYDKLKGFCDDTIWDLQLTWYNSWPQFTECFQHTVLVWVPCGWLWLSAPIYMWYLASLPTHHTGKNFTKLFTIKLSCLCLLILISVLNIPHIIERKGVGENLLKADVFEPVVVSTTLVLALIFLTLEKRKGFVTSGVLFIFWLLLIISNIVNFYSLIKLEVYLKDEYLFAMFYLQFLFYLVEFLLHCFVEDIEVPYKTTKKPSPELSASIPSRLSFFWLDRLMRQGYKSPLTEDALPDLHPRDKCKTVVPRFFKYWKPAVTLTKLKAKKISKSSHVDLLATEETPLTLEASTTSYTDCVTRSKKKFNGPSLVFILIKTFWRDYLLSLVWKFFDDFLLLTSPLILGQLIEYVQQQTSEKWHGYVLAVALFCSSCLHSLFFHQLFHRSTSLGLRVRAAIISGVFRKALTMDSMARKDSTTGEVVNLMSVDASRFESVMSYLWTVWSSPLQIIVSLYLLYDMIGVSIFAGVAFLIAIITANFLVSSKLGSLQTELMTFKDERMKVMNELLSGIKIVKLFAWELSFEHRILEIRNKELLKLRQSALIGSVLSLSWSVAPFVVSLLSFMTYVFISEDHYLDPKTAFVAIALFDILRFAINMAPMIVTDLIKTSISARRIESFLYHDDLDPNNVCYKDASDHAISIKNGVFRWTPDLPSTLKNINITIDDGNLVAVVGTVGSGKSSLISAILGEMEKMEGMITIKGSLAYVSQQAWIQNDTLRNNILFGKPLNEDLYNRCLDGCALRHDLDILPAGDLTEIGERGINLSGGQKQRVALARAIYAQADIYLLDDPLSAVDSHVGKHIFDHVISANGLLGGKVRVLVTHGIQYLPFTDHIIVLTNGEISEAGQYNNLLSHKGPFAKLITTYLVKLLSEDKSELFSKSAEETKLLTNLFLSESEDDDYNSSAAPELLRQLSATVVTENKESLVEEKLDPQQISHQNLEANLIEEEIVATGTVKLSVFKQYGKSLGLGYMLIILVLYSVFTAAYMGASVFLSIWTDDGQLANLTAWPRNSTERMDQNSFYIGIYGALGIVQTVLLLAFTLVLNLRSIHASRKLHSSMLDQVLRAPMSFFDTTPVGRIINRFSKDLDDVDEEIPLTLHMWLECVFHVLATIIIVSYSTPLFMAFILPVGVLYFFIQRYYIVTSRQLKRLGAKTTSPIFNHFSETLAGASVIRAFGAEKRFVMECDSKVDLNQICKFFNYTCNRWLGNRTELVGNLIVLTATLIAVSSTDSISAGIMGLSISYALQITESLNWMVRLTSDMETQVVSLERIVEYTEIETEAAWDNFMYRSPMGWPQDGHVKIEDLSVCYRDGLELVLKSISFEVNPGEKVGIVGRTGAGKSSLVLALFRLVEPVGGRILIDDVDISKLGLHDLRSKVTIIPQDPVIFAGTLRNNLDPFNEYLDEALWTSLEHAHLKSFVESLPDLLYHQCGEGGENLSVGQKQLLCLSRALLRKTKILILDEATAAVDMETDELIQRTIREEFSNCTILTIAHRLNTVMDYDRILVLERGELVEYDKPGQLLQNSGSLFYSMVQAAELL
ncbi:unnamed protein product [Lymnaea stagnalis]|uniref:ABC-type glutathione-S-conjugate transporter n=1 Tax=Lymnaea stagnalis TaxID=6523 RepID=A0AAV2HH02_LYMST